MRRSFLLLSLAAALTAVGDTPAQQSASYRIEEAVLNAGGIPFGGSILSSASFSMRLDAIGEGVAGSGPVSASYLMDSGFVGRYPPPGEVLDLQFPTDDVTLTWRPERSVGSYSLYRGSLASLPGLGYGACVQQGIAAETAIDADEPLAGEAYFYLVTAVSRLSEEGTKGSASDGIERQGATCQ